MNEIEAKQKVIDAGIRLVQSGLIARTWGNVSCRISDTHFVITPSGRDYLTLTLEEIVPVTISDLSYSGEVKPSSEKGIHAEIYSHHPEVNFVIHTHQQNASIVSTLNLEAMTTGSAYPLLGTAVPITLYGLPGTKKLRAGVAAALGKTQGNAIILRNHGVVCFGSNDRETFQVATDLEKASFDFIESQYQKVSYSGSFNEEQMISYVLGKISRPWKGQIYHLPTPYGSSTRTAEGFLYKVGDEPPVLISFTTSDESLPQEAEIHREIYLKRKEIGNIIHSSSPYTLAMSKTNRTLRPLVDDFAQIIGTKAETILKVPRQFGIELKKASAVFIGDNGALCCGATESDALAVEMILEKCSKAQICATLFGSVKPLSWLDSKLMRLVYMKKYSKQFAAKNVEDEGINQ